MMDVKSLIEKVNRAIKSQFGDFRGTYFFGSRARNDHNEDSDYDLLLTFAHKLNWKKKNQIYDLIAEIELAENVIIDIKAYQENELKNRWTPFREKVLKEGIFYGAA
jgi:predicted nucleotidyltransferase